jgi:hypothetical protein
MWHLRCIEEVRTGFWSGNVRKRRTPGRPRRKWEDNIEVHLEEVRWEGMDWIDLALDWDRWWALVNVVMNLRVPQNAAKLVTS